MKTLEVLYHNQEQLDFINLYMKKGPTQEETKKYIEDLRLHDFSSALYSRSPIEFWDVNLHTEKETEDRLIKAMYDFSFIMIKAHEEYYDVD